jgi:hypothetical protein
LEGGSLLPQLRNSAAARSQPAITTHGPNNHAVCIDRWRYIRYSDGGEELYDHEKDPLEWTNLAADARVADVKKQLAKWLPEKEAPNAPTEKKP